MALFFQEFKKIWRPGILAALGLLGAMYYYIFPSFYIEYFCNGPHSQAEFDLAAGWAARYGPTMEPEERKELDAQLLREVETFNGLIAAIPEAQAAGLYSYDDFTAFEDGYLSRVKTIGEAEREQEWLRQRIIGGTNYYVIQELLNFMESYDNFQEYPPSQQSGFTAIYSSAQQVRILELEAAPYGYLPNDSVLHSTWEYGKDLAVWIVLSAVLLLSPTLVRDRLYRLQAMQWVSRRGRRTLNVQFAAGLFSALLLTALNILIYTVPFLGKDPLVFQDFSIYGCGGSFPWFNLTYGGYLLALTGLLVALGLAAGGLTLFLSQYSGNYIAMLLKAIPLFIAVGALLGSWLLDDAFFFRYLDIGSVSKYADVLCASLLLLLSLGLCVWTCRKQKKRELL